MPISEFTHSAYAELIKQIRTQGHSFCDYHNYESVNRPCILRHDVDFDLQCAQEFALRENDCGVKSTYFVLVTSDFYNVFSAQSRKAARIILSCGHEIGLHFDEAAYDEIADISVLVNAEANALSNAFETPVTTVSMHRPSRRTLEANYRFEGLVNSYGAPFFGEFKYLSDSRMNWREDAHAVIASGEHRSLHVLTHPIWYQDNCGSVRDRLLSFITRAGRERYVQLNANLRDLSKIIELEEIV